ncbi:uncharacterized protein LOC127372538 isoform X3 [Dicentrarchus labrax]|uniref:uncharacterized protein LOC127372538 isoform X3 n=1 Tax=Dicentrarchus labrax TaxID=13489 RepID=UPI0021F53467|nr:uncharacterized protein LOC127372538 isoform X3 [Dicentrarchus labrax]
MAGNLLLVVVMYSFSEMKAQALLAPKLTVNQSVITDTDSVTLNCQPPPSVSVSQCYFSTVRGGPATRFSCLQTLTGTELLKMSYQSSPAEVEVKCSYLKVFQSPESETTSITIRTSLPPKLTVNPPVINETDSVTLNCQTPPSFSVTQCHFYILSGGTVRDSSCLQTLTGTELLKMSPQSSPAEVEVMCFYTVKLGEKDSPSPYSGTSRITIHSQTPQMTLQHFHGEYVLFTCSLPGSANHDTRCNLYFGEESDPVKTTTIWKKRSSTNQWFCQFIVTIDDLLRRLCLVKQGDASCDYSLGREPNSLSPRSDRYNLTDTVEKESRMTQTVPTFTMTTGTRSHASTPVTPEKQTSGQTPLITLQHFHGEHVLFTCSLPGSANHDTRCNLYFGEESDPVKTTTIWKKRSSTNQWFCQFIVTIDDLLKRLSLVKQGDVSCDYSLGSEPNSLSPRSDGHSLTDIVERESRLNQSMPTLTVARGLTYSNSGASTPVSHVKTKQGSLTSTDTTLMNPASGDEITEKTILIIGAVVTVVAVLLGLALLFIRSRTERCVPKRPKANFTDDREYMGGYDETYSIVIYECNTGELLFSS